MPLPLIPLLIAIPTIVGTGIGIKKLNDARQDLSKAKNINEKAQKVFDKSKEKLEDMRQETEESLESLGKTKIAVYEKGLIPFVQHFEKIKNIDFNDPDLKLDAALIVQQNEMKDIKEIALKMVDVLSSGAAALTGGALAGFGAFGGAGLLATASTGTAIASLSGVAATNATLAWFGGGALAAGGFGMAGGMAVLGGIVAAPVLLVGGLIMASKAEQAKYDAYSNLEKAEVAAEGMETARKAARAILKRVEEIDEVLQEIESPFFDAVDDLRDIVSDETDYQNYSKKDKQKVMHSAAFAKTIKNILEVPVFDEDGIVTKESKTILASTREFFVQLASM
jgi:methylthioribose-1-phosphate isomerase